METVQVDVQKLQLLNDRIAQTIDALNQLRISSAGLQHTAPGSYAQQPVYAQQQPVYASQQPMVSYIPQQVAGQWIPGLQHTGAGFASPTQQFVQPFGVQPQFQPQLAGTLPIGLGISHSQQISPWQMQAAIPMGMTPGYPRVVSAF